MNIEYIYKRAWQLTRQNKSLWILGATLATLIGSSSSNIRLPSNNGGGNEYQPTSEQEAFNQVIAKAQEGFADAAHEFWIEGQHLLSLLPWWIIVLFVTGVGLSILYWIVFYLFARSWSYAALIKGIDAADEDGQTSLATTSASAKQVMAQMVFVQLVPMGLSILWFVLMVILIVGGVFALFSSDFDLGVGGILGGALLLLVIGVIFWVITTSLGGIVIWAHRFVVLQGQRVRDALWYGWLWFKQTLFSMLLLGVANWFVGCFGGCTLSILMLLIVVPFILLIMISPYAIAIVLPLILLAVLVGTFVAGFFVAFKEATWNIFCKTALQKAQQESSDVSSDHA